MKSRLRRLFLLAKIMIRQNPIKLKKFQIELWVNNSQHIQKDIDNFTACQQSSRQIAGLFFKLGITLARLTFNLAKKSDDIVKKVFYTNVKDFLNILIMLI